MVEKDIFLNFDACTCELHLNALYHNREREGDRNTSTSDEMKRNKNNVCYYLPRIVLFFSYQRISLLNLLFLVTAQAIE
jgi:hypothetical protein